jgi:hypothetical protein
VSVLVWISSLTIFPICSFAQQGQDINEGFAKANPLAGKTVRFLSEKCGSGVLYFSSDGRAFIWHPGRIDVSVGVWREETFRITHQPGTAHETISVTHTIAVQFPDRLESNPVLKTFAGLFAYLDPNNIAGDLGVLEAADGDAVGLEDLRPPCRMCRVDMTFAQMERP